MRVTSALFLLLTLAMGLSSPSFAQEAAVPPDDTKNRKSAQDDQGIASGKAAEGNQSAGEACGGGDEGGKGGGAPMMAPPPPPPPKKDDPPPPPPPPPPPAASPVPPPPPPPPPANDQTASMSEALQAMQAQAAKEAKAAEKAQQVQQQQFALALEQQKAQGQATIDALTKQMVAAKQGTEQPQQQAAAPPPAPPAPKSNADKIAAGKRLDAPTAYGGTEEMVEATRRLALEYDQRNGTSYTAGVGASFRGEPAVEKEEEDNLMKAKGRRAEAPKKGVTPALQARLLAEVRKYAPIRASYQATPGLRSAIVPIQSRILGSTRSAQRRVPTEKPQSAPVRALLEGVRHRQKDSGAESSGHAH